MALANCERCGQLFNRVTRSICPNCVKEEEKSFDEVKEYIRSHDSATISEVAEATQVSEERVLHYLREGRLELSGTLTYACESCGTPIRTGRFCSACQQMLGSDIAGAAKALKQQLLSKDSSGYYSQNPTLRGRGK